MTSDRQRAAGEFRRILKWIVLIAAVMVAAALFYLNSSGDLTLGTVIATSLGVFLSVVLGCGLFAAAFFSNKSGIDQQITDSTRHEREGKDSQGDR